MPAGLPDGLVVCTHAARLPPAGALAASNSRTAAMSAHKILPRVLLPRPRPQTDTPSVQQSASSRDSGPRGKRRSLVESMLSARTTAPRAESGSLEGDVLRLERQNVSLMRALAREEECR